MTEVYGLLCAMSVLCIFVLCIFVLCAMYLCDVRQFEIVKHYKYEFPNIPALVTNSGTNYITVFKALL